MNVHRTSRTLWVVLSSSVMSMLLLAVAAPATVATTTIKPATTSLIPGLSDPDPKADREITAKDINLGDAPSKALLRSSLEKLIYSNLTSDAKYDRIFNVELPITHQDAASDIDQMLFIGSDAGPLIAGPHRQVPSLGTLELVADSLGSTTIANRNRSSSGAGFPLSLAAIFVVLLCSGLVSLAFLVLRRHA